MDMGLESKSVLVMASAGGIGKGIATEFARAGGKVMLFDRDEAALLATRDQIEQQTGNRPSISVGDMTSPGDIERAVKLTAGSFGGLFALINNTGGPPAGGFDDFDDEAWTTTFELTLLSYVRAIRAALPYMREAGEGRILNNTSSSTKHVIDNLLLSNAFRTGILGMSKSIARELGPDGILVNVIGPGKIATERVAHLDEMRARKASIPVEEVVERNVAAIPLGRYGQTDEIARMAVFLCSGANTYVTGQNILVDGGMVGAY